MGGQFDRTWRQLGRGREHYGFVIVVGWYGGHEQWGGGQWFVYRGREGGEGLSRSGKIHLALGVARRGQRMS